MHTKYMHIHIYVNVLKIDHLVMEMCFREVIGIWLKNIFMYVTYIIMHIPIHTGFSSLEINNYQLMCYKKCCR